MLHRHSTVAAEQRRHPPGDPLGAMHVPTLEASTIQLMQRGEGNINSDSLSPGLGVRGHATCYVLQTPRQSLLLTRGCASTDLRHRTSSIETFFYLPRPPWPVRFSALMPPSGTYSDEMYLRAPQSKREARHRPASNLQEIHGSNCRNEPQ